MGERNRYRQRFFEAHPICCFCGGLTPAQTIEHIPAKIFFDLKSRPDDFVMPACKNCNEGTGKEDQIAAFIARMYPDSEISEVNEETARLMRAISNNYPGLLESMMTTSRDRRKFLDRYFKIKPVQFGDTTKLPVIKLSNPVFHKSVMIFGRKLACAIHYNDTRKIIPPNGCIFLQWRTNAQFFENEIPKSFLEILGPLRTLRQGKKHVSEQFVLRAVHSNDGNLSAFAAKFRKSYMLLGMVNCSSHGKAFSVDDGISFHPFSW